MNLKTGATIMYTTNQFLDLCADKLGTDYQTSKALGKHASYVSNMRGRGGILTDEIGLKVAEILGFPKDAMLLCLAAERSLNTPHFKEIQRLAEQHTPEDLTKFSPSPQQAANH